jgi:hypothetical protein
VRVDLPEGVILVVLGDSLLRALRQGLRAKVLINLF